MTHWAKRAAAKEEMARRRHMPGGASPAQAGTPRLPPGQSLTHDWPILDLGTQPVIPMRDWLLTVGGLVRRPLRLSYDALLQLPPQRQRCDIHCVTGWSHEALDATGVPAGALLDQAAPLPQARFCIIKSYDGYTTCLPLADLQRPQSLLLFAVKGCEPLSRAHGGPVRLLVPHLYLWKSAKWLRQLWLTDRAVKGHWEARGYHERGDPWLQQRYTSDGSNE
jgi:DMSO/TMAO reductase YedYZ molybdopterin-dependent catalytic subunit